jgi:hypothetical protein
VSTAIPAAEAKVSPGDHKQEGPLLKDDDMEFDYDEPGVEKPCPRIMSILQFQKSQERG